MKRQLARCLFEIATCCDVSEFETSESEEDANMVCLTSQCDSWIPSMEDALVRLYHGLLRRELDLAPITGGLE